MERVKRIELSSSAWKAEVLPLNYTRIGNIYLMKAATGFEPVIKVLQTSALPLGYAAMTGLEGFEPSHDGIKIRCLTAWL